MMIRARRNRNPVLLYPHGYITCPLPEPPQPGNDQRPECEGCPYPRHGLSCGGPCGCLLSDMREIMEKDKKHRAAGPNP